MLASGEWATPGATVVDLVQVNAFRDETLHGHVVAISPAAVVQQEDTIYTLMIELEPTGLNLWPGMTVQVARPV